MLHIGICDDSFAARAQLRSVLEHNLYDRHAEYNIFEFSSGEGVLGWFANHTAELDLLFLDIEMNAIDGMEAARRIREQNQTIQLVFVTGYADYVFDGYSVGALDYLIKPVQPEHLDQVLVRTFAAMHRAADTVYLCHNSDGVYRIPRQEILYFSSDRRLITCVTTTRSYTFYGKLDEVESELNDPSFLRIHQRYLIRKDSVGRVTDNSVRIQNKDLPISRSYKKEAVFALTRTFLEDEA